jgi:hypothetical protein
MLHYVYSPQNQALFNVPCQPKARMKLKEAYSQTFMHHNCVASVSIAGGLADQCPLARVRCLLLVY